MATADGRLLIKTKVDDKGIKTGTRDIERGLTGATKSMAKFAGTVAATFAVRELVQFGKTAIKLASDLQEVQNVVDVAFGSMSYKIEQFSKTSIEMFGISELTAKQTASAFAAMAKGMQFGEEAASNMAIELTKLAADMASFYNISQDQARTALAAIYTGRFCPAA